MHTIQANGADLHVALSGPEQGPAVMFSNSLGTDLRVWDELIPHLPRGLRLVRYDKRGHGLSEETPGPYSIETLADDAAALIEALGLKKVVFVGLSIGGLIGQSLAARRPVVLRPVVLGAVLNHWGQLGPAEIAPKRVHTYRLCQFLAEGAGVPLRFPPAHPFRSLDALRLLAALDGEPHAVRTVFEFVWAEGRDPSEPGERAALCERLGIGDPDALIAAQDAKSRLRAWTDGAIAAGVFGVPTLAVGPELFWGLDAMPMAQAVLDDPGLLGRGEMARVATLPAGVERTMRQA